MYVFNMRRRLVILNLSRCCNHNYSRFTELLYYQFYCTLIVEYTSSLSLIFKRGNTPVMCHDRISLCVDYLFILLFHSRIDFCGIGVKMDLTFMSRSYRPVCAHWVWDCVPSDIALGRHCHDDLFCGLLYIVRYGRCDLFVVLWLWLWCQSPYDLFVDLWVFSGILSH